MTKDHVTYTIEVDHHSFSANEFEKGRIEVTRIDPDSMPVRPLERGLVVFNPKANTYSFLGDTNIDQKDWQSIVEQIGMLHLQ